MIVGGFRGAVDGEGGGEAAGGGAADLDLDVAGADFAFAVFADDQGELLRGDGEGDIFLLAGFQRDAGKADELFARRGESRSRG